MSLILDGTNGTTFNDGSNQPAAASPYTLKNRIINGDFRIDQRNAGASITPTNGQFSVDRWACFLSQSSKYTVQQDAGAVTPPAGFNNYLGVTSSSAYTVGSAEWFGIAQRIEGFNIADLGWGTANAKTVTLSFWVRSSLTGTFGGSLNNNGFNYNYPFSYTISAANTWEYKTVTIPGPTAGTWLSTNGLGVQVHFGLGLGSTFSATAGSWVATSNILSATGATSVVGTSGATFYITGVQLEQNTSATPFERRLYGQELANCQRYFQLIVSGLDKPIAVGDYYTATQVEAVLQTKVTMRTAPTLSSTTGTNYYRAARNGGTDTFNSLTGDISFENALLVYNASEASGTAGHGTRLETSSASAFLAFQAEL